MHRLTLLAAIGGTLALAATGCGSSDDKGDSGDKAASDNMAAPQVKQPASALLPEFNRAIASQSCQTYAPYALTFTRPAAATPGSPAIAKEECARYRQLLAKNLKNVKFTQAQQFGTVALAQGPGPRQSGYTNHTGVFVLDWDGKYRFYLTNASDPQIGSSPKAGTDYAGTVDTFVKAVRDKDCAAFQRVTYPNAGPNLGVQPAAACKSVFEGHNLAPQLRADPSAKAVKLGETLDFGFYGVATKKNFYTFIANTTPVDAGPEWKGKAKTVVIDYFPNYQPVA